MQLSVTPLKVLTDEDLQRIIDAARRVVARVGMRIEGTDELFDYLHDFGCEIGPERVHFPPAVVDRVWARIEEARAQRAELPTKFEPSVTTGESRLVVSHESGVAENGTTVPDYKPPENGTTVPDYKPPAELHYGASGQGLWCCDPATDQVRPATRQDLADFSRVVEAIPNLERHHPTFLPQDVPPLTRDLHAYITIILNSSQPYRVSVYSTATLKYFIEVSLVVYGSLEEVRKHAPFATKMWVNSPFMLSRENVTLPMAAREQLGRPLEIGLMPVAGVATPATLAGCLVHQTAEVLACNVLSLAVDDRLMGYCAGPLVFDLKNAVHTQTGPDAILLRVGAAQVAGALFGGTPTPALGPVTAAKQPGVQSVMEKAIETSLGILAGVRHFGSLATLAFADVGSVVQLMLDVEMMQYFERLLQGIDTDPERLAEEVIAEVAPRGAYFLEHPHTLKYYREELWSPELMDRRVPAAWMRDPRTMLDHARDKALRLLATAPNRCPLTPDQRRELKQVAVAAEREVG